MARTRSRTMERVGKERTEGFFLRSLPYLIAILLVLAIEFLYFGTGLPLTMVMFMVVAILAMLLFLVKPYLTIIALFAIKPVLDIMWSVDVGGWKGTYIMGALGPLLWAFGMLYYKISPLGFRMGRTMIFWGLCTLIPLILAPFLQGFIDGFWTGLYFWMRFVNGWGFFFLLPFLVKNRKEFNWFIYAWLASTLVPGFLGLYYLVTNNPAGFQITAGWWRIAGPYHDAAAFMTEITPALPIMLYLASGARRWWKKGIWIVLTGLWLILVFNAYTRAWWIATAIVLLIWSLARLWQPLLLALAGALYKWPVIWKRFTTAGVEELESTYALGGRVGLWEDFWRSFKESAILDKLLGRWAAAKGWEGMLDFHSQYLMTIANLGIIGLVGLLSIMVGFLYHLLRDLADPSWRREALLGLSVLTMVIVLSASGKLLMVPNNQWFFFGFMGLIINTDIEHHET